MAGSTLFFDTETSDKFNFKAHPCDPSQPHLVQLALILDDPAGNTMAEVSLIVSLPEGVECSPGAAAVHGISAERIKTYGVSRKAALYLFDTFARTADTIVAHNADFDLKVLGVAYHREGKAFELPTKSYCTMKNSTDICKIPGRYNSTYKWPQLQEAYSLLVNAEGFEGAHDALADTRACRDIYYKLTTPTPA